MSWNPYALGAASQQVGGPPQVPPSPFPNSKRVAREYTVSGIQARIHHLRDMIKRSILDVDISRKLALGITAGCPRRDNRCELEALWRWMHGLRTNGLPNVRYTGDIQGYDTFQSARSTLDYGGGDCDDGMVLVAALALGNQFCCKGRITVNPGADGWSHIYPLVGLPKNNPRMWWPFDWTLGFHYFGVAPPEDRHVEFDGDNMRYSPRELTVGEYQGW